MHDASRLHAFVEFISRAPQPLGAERKMMKCKPKFKSNRSSHDWAFVGKSDIIGRKACLNAVTLLTVRRTGACSPSSAERREDRTNTDRIDANAAAEYRKIESKNDVKNHSAEWDECGQLPIVD